MVPKVVKQLLGSNQPANIQRKALEVLNARFAQKELANPNIPAILQCLARLAMTENKESCNVLNKGKGFSFSYLPPWIVPMAKLHSLIVTLCNQKKKKKNVI